MLGRATADGAHTRPTFHLTTPPSALASGARPAQRAERPARGDGVLRPRDGGDAQTAAQGGRRGGHGVRGRAAGGGAAADGGGGGGAAADAVEGATEQDGARVRRRRVGGRRRQGGGRGGGAGRHADPNGDDDEHDDERGGGGGGADAPAIVGPVSSASALKKDKLNLSGLLNVLDGVVDTPERIVVMTTNHPEILDPALIRPGRIDQKLLLGYMNARNVIEMIKHYFQVGDDSAIDLCRPARGDRLRRPRRAPTLTPDRATSQLGDDVQSTSTSRSACARRSSAPTRRASPRSSLTPARRRSSSSAPSDDDVQSMVEALGREDAPAAALAGDRAAAHEQGAPRSRDRRSRPGRSRRRRARRRP